MFKIIFLVIALNCYFIFALFHGQNTILNYFSYKEKYSKLSKQKHDLLEQRYKLDQIISILEDKNSDVNDILDELLRNNTQSSLPEEKIVLLKKT
jgi:cell division protein FtsB